MNTTMTLRREAPSRLPGWLQPAPADMVAQRNHFFKNAFAELGLRAAFELPLFALQKRTSHLLTALRVNVATAPNIPLTFPREKFLGTAALIGIIASCTALSGNATVAATAAMPIVTATSTNISAATTDVENRKELGIYADPEYRYPHLRIETGMATPTIATFTAFHGKYIGRGLYSRLLGVKEEIPQTAVVDVNDLRDTMFRLKYANNDDVTPSARKMQGQYAEMYNIQRTHMTLRQFVQGVDMVIKESVASIDWDGLCADPKLQLNGEQCALAQKLAGQITAEEQVTYGITEQLANDGKNHGVYNAYVVDMGLRNFGREFFDLVPAQGDGMASGGFWQFTCYAVGAYNRLDKKTERMVPEIAPVTIVSRHAAIKVPESFLNFKRTDHERASVYFRVSNLAFLVRDAAKNKKAYETLERVANGGYELDMLTFTATSHHAHNKVRTDFAMPWLKDGARKPFASYLRGRFVEYGAKTRINFPGLNAYLHNESLAGLPTQKGDRS